jgi:hypothetical protein
MKFWHSIAFAAIAACLCSPVARAEQIAVHAHKVNNKLALEIILHDTADDWSEGASECEKKGMRHVFLQAVSAVDAPLAHPYGKGCWYAKDRRVWLEARSFEDGRPFKLNFPASSFKPTESFLSWPAYARYAPITDEQARARKQQEKAEADARDAAKEKSDAVAMAERTIRCNSTPFPYAVMKRLELLKIVKDVSSGRGPLYAPTEDTVMMGRKLLFISGGGHDGNTEEFLKESRPSGYSYVNNHFAVTLDASPDESELIELRTGQPPLKSRMLFVRDGALDGSSEGVTLVCGFRRY